jgi:peptidoglycan/xylan/chitin deacetylase (PgdA/CDA1 family)
MITVAFRLDDPSETSNQEVEAGILDVLRALHTPCTFAVIPFRMLDGKRIGLSAERARPLVDAAHEGIIEPALHGYVHVRALPEMTQPSEFSGRPHEEQRSMILEGRTHLETVFGQAITGFIPPWNSYDKNTFEILETEGFKYLSSGWRAPSHVKGKIKALPLTAHLGDIPQAIAEARRFISAHPIIVVVMHHYDFAESGSEQSIINLKEFSNTVSGLVKKSDINIQTLAQVSKIMSCTDLPIRQYRMRSKNRLMAHLLPKYSFMSTSLWQGMLAKTFFA